MLLTFTFFKRRPFTATVFRRALPAIDFAGVDFVSCLVGVVELRLRSFADSAADNISACDVTSLGASVPCGESTSSGSIFSTMSATN